MSKKQPDSDSQRMHHAYLLVGELAEAEEFLSIFLAERGIDLNGSPDFFPFRGSLFGIDEARRVSTQAAGKAFGLRKIFLIAAEKITLEAQNSLLKTFEDPYESTHFFLVARGEDLIIPTLRSRMQVLSAEQAVPGPASTGEQEAEKFLSLSPTLRLDYARKFAEKEKNLSVFLDELMLVLKGKNKFEELKKVYEARRFSDDRGAAPRLILEHLSLVL